MFKPQRLRTIYEIIKKSGQAAVSALAPRFGVSEMTIRRDLEHLEAEGLVRRIHGGAVSTEYQFHSNEPPVIERKGEQAEEKRLLARRIAEFIEEGDTIFLGSGSTTLAVADVLAERNTNLTVITNALTVANALIRASNVVVVLIGGFLRRSELSLVGHLADSMLHDLRVDKVVIGMRGIDPEQGLTSEHLQELKTDQAILQMSNTVIVVADHTKFGRVATSRTAPIEAASLIITSSQAPADIIDAIRARGVEVLQV